MQLTGGVPFETTNTTVARSLTILPAVVIFIFAQRWIVAGLTAGAVKG